MKTNPAARLILRIRAMVLCLALLGMVGIAFKLGEFLAVRVGPPASPKAEIPTSPNVGFADILVAVR